MADVVEPKKKESLYLSGQLIDRIDCIFRQSGLFIIGFDDSLGKKKVTNDNSHRLREDCRSNG